MKTFLGEDMQCSTFMMFTCMGKFHRLPVEKVKVSDKNRGQVLALPNVFFISGGDSPFVVWDQNTLKDS